MRMLQNPKQESGSSSSTVKVVSFCQFWLFTVILCRSLHMDDVHYVETNRLFRRLFKHYNL